MKKIIGAFTAGQMLQLLILFVGQTITYESNLMLFCAVLGVLATLMLLVGSGITSVEMSVQDMDEAAPIPKELKVTNDRVLRDVDALFGKKEGKHE